MAKTTTNFQITKGLQSTLRHNPKIKEVYFNDEGDFFFKKHNVEVFEFDESTTIAIGSKKVESLSGVTKGVVRVKSYANGGFTYVPRLVNINYKPIAATFTRDEVLAAQPVPEKRTEKEKLEILQAAAEIAKDGDIQELLNKINERSKK